MPMEKRRLEGEEAVQHILTLLRKAERPLTTREIQRLSEERRVQCPDSTVVFLNRLRTRGIIRGERSRERRGWVWWIEDASTPR